MASQIYQEKRPSFNLVTYQERYGPDQEDTIQPRSKVFSVLKDKMRKRRKKISSDCVLQFLINRFPLINTFRTYKLNYLLKDLIGGLTVGVIQIAPTMANATTAELPPINGLYVAFFSVMAYFFFGTSKHLSIGTHGVISIMVGNSLKNFEGILYPDDEEMENGGLGNQTNPNYISNNPNEAKILIAMMLAFQAGAIQILLGIINGGFISKYLSDTLVEAFTIGSSYLIVVSQIGNMLGYTVHRLKLPFKMIDNLIGIFRQIGQVQLIPVLISIASMLVIFLVKKYINDKFRKKLPAPIPIELIVVAITTGISYSLEFESDYDVHVVGHVPLGIPQAKLPPFNIFTMLFVEGFSIALVSFALNISMGKLFAKKYNYHINVNQELFAYGLGNILSSLFNGMPAAGGLTRTLIVETSGAKTQMFSLISSAFVLVVFVRLGFLFHHLPYCSLSAIIVISLLHKCLEVTKILKLLRKSLSESIIWLSTFLGVVILDIDYGLYIGLTVSIVSVVVKNQMASTSVLGKIEDTDLFEPIDSFPKAKEMDSVKIVRFEDSIYFANVENFTNSVLSNIGFECDQIMDELDGLKLKNVPTRIDINSLEKNELKKEMEIERAKILNKIPTRDVILDCSCVNFIDMMGVNGLFQMNQLFTKFNVKLHLTGIKQSVLKTIRRIDDAKMLDINMFYPTNSDAVETILANRKDSTDP